MTAFERGQPEREFSKETRAIERLAAHNDCRICGKPRELEILQFAHILTHSQNEKWRRNGTDSYLWSDDKYVSSELNCLLLCTVEYLESLKLDPNHCTALISKGGEVRRYRKPNGRLSPAQAKRSSSRAPAGAVRRKR